MSQAFDAASSGRRYAFVNECPEALLAQVVTLPIGTLRSGGALLGEVEARRPRRERGPILAVMW